MRHHCKIAVVIPAHNEAPAIGRVIADIPDFVDKIIVIDNASTDNTWISAKHAGASVLRESTKGYGAACLAGIEAAREFEVVAFIDADYSDYPEDLTTVIDPVAGGEADLVIGVRTPEPSSATVFTLQQQLGNWLALRTIKLLYGHSFSDLGPMRAIKTSALNTLDMCDNNCGWTVEMQLKALLHGYRVTEVPVRYRQRIGQSKISGTLHGALLAGYKIFYWIFVLAFSQRPTKTI